MIISIGRQYGSGGHLIAEGLAKKLNLPLYDRKIIEETAKVTGLSQDYIKDIESQQPHSFFLSGLDMGLANSGLAVPLSDQVFIAQSEVIREAAKKPCIIVGRCADYVLSDEQCLKVYCYGSLNRRIERVKEEYDVQTNDYRAFIKKMDKKRAGYYEYFTGYKWGNCYNFDLMINTDNGIEWAIEQIEHAYHYYLTHPKYLSNHSH